jgi:hypothetical protein
MVFTILGLVTQIVVNQGQAEKTERKTKRLKR